VFPRRGGNEDKDKRQKLDKRASIGSVGLAHASTTSHQKKEKGFGGTCVSCKAKKKYKKGGLSKRTPM